MERFPFILERHLILLHNHITQPEDIRLYTDAAQSVGFGGYYGGRWLASAWPPELSSFFLLPPPSPNSVPGHNRSTPLGARMVKKSHPHLLRQPHSCRLHQQKSLTITRHHAIHPTPHLNLSPSSLHHSRSSHSRPSELHC